VVATAETALGNDTELEGGSAVAALAVEQTQLPAAVTKEDEIFA